MVSMRPLVISSAHFPPITDPEEAKRSLERAFLSGLVHASEPVAAEVTLAMATALDASPDDVGLYYWDTLRPVLGDAIRSTVDMQMKDWKPRSDWGKQFLADVKNDAIAEGRAEGRIQSTIEHVLDVLDARGLTVDPPLRQRILACTDPELLARWLRRSVTAGSAEEAIA